MIKFKKSFTFGVYLLPSNLHYLCLLQLGIFFNIFVYISVVI